MWAWQQAWRSLARRPAFFAAAVLTLAFGAGVTTAVFSLVDTVLIKPLPYPDADALITVYELSPSARDRRSLVAPGRLEDWNRSNRSFVAISATNTESVTDTSGEEPERLAGVRVAPRFFQVYAQQPIAGRWFTADEELDTGPSAAVISERFWTRRFNRDPSAIGRALTIGGKGYPIVGVMPATFTAATTDVWLPWKINARLLGQRAAPILNGVGRRRPGIIGAEGYRFVGHLVDDASLPVDPHVRPRIQIGRGMSARDYLLTLAEREEHRRAFAAALADTDALLTPTTQTAAIPIDTVDQSGTAAHFTRVVNYVGACALSLPNGFTASGLPASLHIVCPAGDEAMALRIGWAYEQATPWKERRPPEPATR